MKKISFIIILAASTMASCSNNNTSNGQSSKTLIVASDTATVRYQCPMKDQSDTTYTTEGKCPKCGMDLKKIN